MKASKQFVFSLALLLLISSAISQTLSPILKFDDHPGTHNVHVCSDGKFIYTVNGGKPFEGKISKFDKKGNLLREYPIELDIRSIMYNSKDKHFYVNCFDQNVYQITDMESGAYSMYLEDFYSNDQAGLAVDPKGENLYYLDNGTLRVYDFISGQLKDTYYDIKCGPSSFDGGAVVAVGKKYIYTWNSVEQEIYLYSHALKLIKTVKIHDGDYGFSLSYTKKYVFVSKDGDYDVGTWYGYKIK